MEENRRGSGVFFPSTCENRRLLQSLLSNGRCRFWQCPLRSFKQPTGLVGVRLLRPPKPAQESRVKRPKASEQRGQEGDKGLSHFDFGHFNLSGHFPRKPCRTDCTGEAGLEACAPELWPAERLRRLCRTLEVRLDSSSTGLTGLVAYRCVAG